MQIYGLIDPTTNQLRYVGLTTTDIEQRLRTHISLSRPGKARRHVNNWIRKLLEAGHRPEAFCIDTANSIEELKELEVGYIAYFKSIGCRLCNITDGGDVGGRGLSLALTGKKYPPRSPEHCKQISEFNKGRKRSPEHIKKMQEARWSHTEETKKKMSEARKGVPKSEEHKRKISRALRNRKRAA